MAGDRDELEPPSAQQLRATALRLLAQREHSRCELERKLGGARQRRQAPAPELLAQVLDQLQQQGLLDEARFAQALARRLVQRHGRQRVLLELRQHGLDPQLTERALREAQDEAPSEVERALRLLRSHGARAGAGAAERARWGRLLQRRGFDADVVRQALRACNAGSREDRADDDRG